MTWGLCYKVCRITLAAFPSDKVRAKAQGVLSFDELIAGDAKVGKFQYNATAIVSISTVGCSAVATFFPFHLLALGCCLDQGETVFSLERERESDRNLCEQLI